MKTLIYFSIFVLIFIISIIIYIITTLVIDRKKIKQCKKVTNTFCGINTLDLRLPDSILRDILALKNMNIGSRIDVPYSKAGRSITNNDILKYVPQLYPFYKNLEKSISNIIGENVSVTPLETDKTSMLIVFYENENDFINWHYDVNYYNGRFFTLLIPVTYDNTCCNFVYLNKYDKEIHIKNKTVLIEGDIVYHKTTKLCKNEFRAIVALQYTTDTNMSVFSKIRKTIKNIGWSTY